MKLICSVFLKGRTNVIDVTKLPVIRKRVKPIGKQGMMESRRLWNEVTNALAEGDISRATEHKRNVMMKCLKTCDLLIFCALKS